MLRWRQSVTSVTSFPLFHQLASLNQEAGLFHRFGLEGSPPFGVSQTQDVIDSQTLILPSYAQVDGLTCGFMHLSTINNVQCQGSARTLLFSTQKAGPARGPSEHGQNAI
jgi:hypothetical protein